MLVAQNFLPLISLSLKFNSCLTVSLHKSALGTSKFLEIAKDKQLRRRAIWAHVPYVVAMLSQWIHGWWRFPQSTLIQSMPYTTQMPNIFMIEVEHYQMRNQLAILLNAFLEFERRHNRSRVFLLNYIMRAHLLDCQS